MNLIIVRFDDVSNGEESRKLICYVRIPIVPDVGEIVNLEGNLYKITRRGWAIEGTTTRAPNKWCGPQPLNSKLYAYLDCIEG